MSRIARLMPTMFGRNIIVFDDFNRADGALGNAVTGQAWSTISGTLAIVSNSFKATGLNTNMAVIDTGATNVSVSAYISHNSIQSSPYISMLVLRAPSTKNRMILSVTKNTLTIARRINDASVNLATQEYATSNATYKYTFVAIDNNFYGYVNDVLAISATNDNALKTETSCGIILHRANNVPLATADNFIVEAL